MVSYAQLDEANTVVGISYLTDEVNWEHMINISSLAEEPILGSIYNRSQNIFILPDKTSEPIAQPTIEEQILAETQYQTALLEVNAVGGNV